MSEQTQKFDSAGWPIIEPPQAASGATHVAGPGGLVPIEVFNAAQKERLDAIKAWREQPRPPLPPRPDRATLMAALDTAKQRRDRAKTEVAYAEAILTRAHDAKAGFDTALAKFDAEETAVASDLATRLRAWLRVPVGQRPQAKPSVDAVQRLQAEGDVIAAQKAVAALQDELDTIKAQHVKAQSDVHTAARAIIRLDAIETAEKIRQLEKEAGALWHQLWGHAYAGLAGGFIPGHPIVTIAIQTPPRLAERAGVPVMRMADRSAQARDAVQARFAALVYAEEVEPWTPPPAA